ncbi:thioesterase II family protein [Kitasatospora sp. NPDC001261]|uniref:thioesterase II family protein n=1 Tax=Kitasatospora sp. NPDC001261 TaxID=3364012 RepID=UPI0036C78B9B
MAAPRWLMCRQRRPDAALRLYCFPHSGGSPGEYLRWADRLPAEVEVWGVQLPGRGSRMREPAMTDLRELVGALTEQAEFTGPYAFLGHSLGAIVAYETAVALRALGRPEPERLIVSVNGPPHLHRPGLPLHLLDGVDFVPRVEERYGPLPPELGNDPRMRELYLANLHADLTVVATYRHVPTAPLSCPVLALGATDDWEDEGRLREWGRHTTGPSDVRILPGGHFYFRDHPDLFFDCLTDSLGALTGAPAVRSAPDPKGAP